MMAVESRWWSGITRYANGRSAGPRGPLAIRGPRSSRHKKKGSTALIPSSLGYQLCGYRHCLSQERNTAGAVGTQPVGLRKSEASSAVGMSKEESKDFVWDGNEAQFAAADKMLGRKLREKLGTLGDYFWKKGMRRSPCPKGPVPGLIT